LQQTVTYLARTMKPRAPDGAMAARIQANLAKEWQQSVKAPAPAQQKTQPKWWEVLFGPFLPSSEERWRSPRRSRQAYSFALAGLTVLVLVSLVVFGTSSVGGQSAAAGGSAVVAIVGL